MVNVAVLGYGTVGSGVVEVIRVNNDVISARVGDDVKVKYVLDLRDFPGDPVMDILVHDYQIIVEDPEVDVVVEVMGGVEPAYSFSKAAILAGKHVCTSNKELVAKHGAELIRLAKEKQVNYMFEASVGGGIPIIRNLNDCLTADRIEEIEGIINGTTNYMLSKMHTDGADYDEILKDAQAKGYAERHPEADVEGYDACRKIAILTSLISGKCVNWEDIPIEGITRITSDDMAYAHAMGRRIKLLATSRAEGDTYVCQVAPFLVGREHPLYAVKDVFNAIFVRGNVLGDAMFYGRGAGKLPTASAVVADVVDCAKHLNSHVGNGWSEEKLALGDVGGIERRFFVRIDTTQSDLKKIRSVFGDVEIVDGGIPEELGVITPMMTEEAYAATAAKLLGVQHMIRLED